MQSEWQPLAAPPLRFLTLQRVFTRSSSMRPGLPSPVTSVFRCSQPRDAFIRPSLTGPVSCQIRSWVCPSELCSFREAVHCFQRRYPLGVAITFRVLLCSKVRYACRRFRPNMARSSPEPYSPSGQITSLRWLASSSNLPSCAYPLCCSRLTRPALQGLNNNALGQSFSR